MVIGSRDGIHGVPAVGVQGKPDSLQNNDTAKRGQFSQILVRTSFCTTCLNMAQNLRSLNNSLCGKGGGGVSTLGVAKVPEPASHKTSPKSSHSA